MARHASAGERDRELEAPSEADGYVERFYRDGAMLSRRTVGGGEEFARQEAGYADFADRIEGDLDRLYEPGTAFEFGEPAWDEELGAYVVEGVGVDDAEVDGEVAIETCRLRVNADGVVVGVSVTLETGSTREVRLAVDGATDPDLAVEEPSWTDEAGANLPLWAVAVGERPTTTVHEAVVHVSSSTGLLTVDREDASERWAFPLEAMTAHAVDGESVYVGTNAGEVYALAREDGTERWRDEVDGNLPYPTVVDDVVVFASLGGVYTFDAADGSTGWTLGGDRTDGARVFEDGTVVATAGGVVTALDASTGSKLWETDTGARNWVSPSVLADGRIYAGAYHGAVYAFDATDGTIDWEVRTAEATASVIHADGTVYAGDRSGRVYAFDADDGSERWTHETGDTARPHAHGEYVYVGSHDGSLYRLSAADGSVDWTFDTGGRVERPAITDDAVFVGSRDSNLYAIEADSGEERWQREVRFWVRYAPTVSDGVVYATDHGRGGGIVYAYETDPA